MTGEEWVRNRKAHVWWHTYYQGNRVVLPATVFEYYQYYGCSMVLIYAQMPDNSIERFVVDIRHCKFLEYC